MQVLSQDFIKQYPQQIINISSFVLARVHRGKSRTIRRLSVGKADRATAHYVTEVLDDGADHRAGCNANLAPRCDGGACGERARP